LWFVGEEQRGHNPRFLPPRSIPRYVESIESTHTSTPNAQEFLRDFETYRAVYERLQTKKEVEVGNRLFTIGREIRQGTRSWTKSDLKDIVRWKRMHRLIPRIENARDIEERLAHAFMIEDERPRIEALCEIPSIGPALASVMLESTSPEMCGALNYHAWNALRLLSFSLPKKRASHDSYTVHELLRYLEVVRRLAREKGTTPAQIGKALYAFDKTVTDKRWKRQFTLALRRFTTPVLLANGRRQFADGSPTSNSMAF